MIGNAMTQTEAPAAPQANRSNPVLRAGLAFGAVTALFSATARPSPKTLDWLVAQGVSEGAATVFLHIAPVIAIGGSVALGGMLGRRLKPLPRALMLAGSGMIGGFLLAVCLDLFAAVADVLRPNLGGLGEPGGVELAAWSVAVISILLGLMVLAVRVFGRSAVELAAIRTLSVEQAAVTRRDRELFMWAGACSIVQGVAVAAFALLHQSAPETELRLPLAMFAGGAGIATVALQAAVYLRMDEFLRRAAIDAFAVSGALAVVGLGGWALFEEVGLAPPVTAFGAFVGLLLVQSIVAMALATLRTGSLTGECADFSSEEG